MPQLVSFQAQAWTILIRDLTCGFFSMSNVGHFPDFLPAGLICKPVFPVRLRFFFGKGNTSLTFATFHTLGHDI
jgi:hypothetical protein